MTIAKSPSIARLADRYIGRDGAPIAAPTGKAAVDGERHALEFALEEIRKALPRSKTGYYARHQLDVIEEILKRDYGLWQKIRPLR